MGHGGLVRPSMNASCIMWAAWLHYTGYVRCCPNRRSTDLQIAQEVHATVAFVLKPLSRPGFLEAGTLADAVCKLF